jgi:protein tyrosine phosphatase (PTP) superfamily phosphohydrolase (DUF442 family)
MIRLDSLLVDLASSAHLSNRHRVGDRAPALWASIISVIRGPGYQDDREPTRPACAALLARADACRELGLVMIDCQMRSRAAPSHEELRRARELFDRIEYPMLMHCKSGADRAGLMSALYRHSKLGDPIEVARNELSFRYGHIRQADTGILDHFFESTWTYAAIRPIKFWDWVETVYDPEVVTRSFKADGFVTRLISTIMRRE